MNRNIARAVGYGLLLAAFVNAAGITLYAVYRVAANLAGGAA